MWWTIGIPLSLIASGGAIIAAVVFTRDFPGARGLALIAATLFSLATLTDGVLVPPLRYRRWRYEIRERDVFLSKGAIFFEMTLVPFDRIQYVESRQGPIDRAFSLAQVHIYTAAGRAAQIPGLSIPEAERLREELSKVAGTSSV